MRNLLVLIACLLITNFSLAQSSLKLPEENPDLAREHYVLLSDHYDNQAYEESYASLLWIMENAPDMHESAYLLGQKTIKKLLDQYPDNEKYKEAMMKVYDHRIKYFGNEIKVLNRKAYDAYKYYRNNPERLEETIKIFEGIDELEGRNLKANLLYPYFDLKVLQHKSKVISDEDLIRFYEHISDVINSKLESGPNENLGKVQKLIDTKLSNSIPLDCDRIEQLFISGDSDQPFSLQQAKLIIKLSIAYKCTEETYFSDAIKILFNTDPTVKLAKIIASFHLEKSEYDSAISYFQKSLDLTQDLSEKSIIYFDMAGVYSAKGDKYRAREMAYQSLKFDRSNLSNYRLIGDLYYNSYDDCKEDHSRVQDRSVFFAAYEKYSLAGDHDKMRLAEQQFPSMESIHTENFHEGQVINTKCWMAEDVKIRRRPIVVSN